MTDLFQRFIELYREKKQLEAELKAVNGELTDLNDDLIEEMAELGIENFKTDRGETIYIHTRTCATPLVSREEAAGALSLAGHGDLVSLNFHAGSVSSLFRELEEQGEIEECLLEAFKIDKIYTARVRGINIRKG